MRNNSFYCVKIPLELRKKFANFRLALEPENTTFGSAVADFGADFSNDRKYRYSLWRIWDRTKPLVMFIGLNPSTANETENDATIRSVGRIAKANGYGGFYMMNCWAYISTDPEKLRDHRFNELICEWNDNMLNGKKRLKLIAITGIRSALVDDVSQRSRVIFYWKVGKYYI